MGGKFFYGIRWNYNNYGYTGIIPYQFHKWKASRCCRYQSILSKVTKQTKGEGLIFLHAPMQYEEAHMESPMSSFFGWYVTMPYPQWIFHVEGWLLKTLSICKKEEETLNIYCSHAHGWKNCNVKVISFVIARGDISRFALCLLKNFQGIKDGYSRTTVNMSLLTSF